MDPELKKRFDELKNIPPRDQQAAEHGRVEFLNHAALLRQADSKVAVQAPEKQGRKGFSLFQGRTHLPVWSTVAAIVLAVVFFFGGTGLTVFAAQDSLPDQVLYPLKTWSEDAMLSVTISSQTRLDYVLDFSDRRVSEISGLLEGGKPIPEMVLLRLQTELDQALELTAGMGDVQAIQLLEQIRLRAEAQYQEMTALMSSAPASDEPVLLKIHARLQEQVQLAALGESDLSEFRMQIQQRSHNLVGTVEGAPTSDHTPQGSGPMRSTGTPVPSATTGKGNGSGNGMDNGTGSGNGSGTGMNQPTGGTGQPGSGAHTPVRTPQPGAGSGNGP